MTGFARRAAIAGIGATEFSKNSGRSEWQLACESVLAALDDAQIPVEQVDGMALFTMENNPEIAVARALGIPQLKFFSRIPHGGGGACGPVQQAALAVAAGVADVVVVYRAFNERSGHRFGSGPPPFAYTASTDQEYRNWINPYGLLTPAAAGGVPGPALHAPLRRHQRRLRSHLGTLAQARRDQPEGVVPRPADHAGGPPELEDDRRSAAAARLLPGVRRRAGAGDRVGRAGQGSAARRRR